MELVQLLTSQLGVTEEQAKGGSGLILQMAKKKLESGEFGQISSAVPEVEDLIASAPKASGISGMFGDLASSFGEAGKLASLAGGFKYLNMDSEMIGKFVPFILSFVHSKSGDTVKNILEKVIK
jgi:hypothetical protein